MRTLEEGTLHTEKVGYWFFRLNGCLTIENFVVHPDFGDPTMNQRTDVDILGVRFPHRREDPQSRPMRDHRALTSDVPLLFIAEVKLSRCRLNGPWTRPDLENLPRVLRATGLHPPSQVDAVARALYGQGCYRDGQSEVRMYAIGDVVDEALRRRRRRVPQLTWEEVLAFIHERFTSYGDIKRSHHQWDYVGNRLFQLAMREPDRERFVELTRAMLEDGHGHRLGPRAERE